MVNHYDPEFYGRAGFSAIPTIHHFVTEVGSTVLMSMNRF